MARVIHWGDLGEEGAYTGGVRLSELTERRMFTGFPITMSTSLSRPKGMLKETAWDNGELKKMKKKTRFRTLRVMYTLF